MAIKRGILGRIASKTVVVGREHVAKVLKGAETLPEAAGAAVEDLLSGSKARSAPKTATKKAAKKKAAIKRKPTTATSSARKKYRSK